MFKRIYFFFLTYIAAMTYGQTLFFLWFFKNGVSYASMFLYFIVLYLIAMLLYWFLDGIKFSSKFALLIGVATSALGVLTAIFVAVNTMYIFLISFFFAINLVFFWTIYNSLHFQYSKAGDHGLKSGAYYLLTPIVSMFLAPLAGLVAEKVGYNFLFLSSLLLYIIPYVFVFYLPSFDFKFETREALSKTQHPLLVFFQGYIFMLSYAVIPIFTLSFINTPFKLGNFFGYLAVFTAIAALLNSKISDRIKKRAPFFYIFSILNVLSYLPLVFSRSLINWQMFAGISNLTYSLSSPFNLTLILDHAKLDTVGTMVGREIYLAFGKLTMLSFAVIIFYLTSSLWTALIYSAIFPLLYPLVAYYQRIYLK